MRHKGPVLRLIIYFLCICVGPSSHAGDWQENFAYEKVDLLNRVDKYRECIALASSRESMRGCRY